MIDDELNMEFESSSLTNIVARPSLYVPSNTLVADQYFWGNGKLLLAGEYLVLEGGKALGLPTKLGQSLSVKYRASFEPVLYWKSFDHQGNIWVEVRFEFWRFHILDENPSEQALILQKILRQARKQNPHFLRDEVDVFVETRASFPLDWGLGSSSTLVHNVASWAFTGPFELLFKTLGGSGIDVAVAQSDCPILYEKRGSVPQWSHAPFAPSFSSELYFVYLGNKQNTSLAVESFKKKQYSKEFLNNAISRINPIVDSMVTCPTGEEFSKLMTEHESILSELLEIPSISETHFKDFMGSVKSLGAWGGDFLLARAEGELKEVEQYFKSKNYTTVLSFDEMVLSASNINQGNYTGQENGGKRH